MSMFNLSNMPIARKIGLSLGLLILLCIGLTGYALDRITILSGNTAHLATVEAGAARLAAGMNENLSKMQQLGFETIVESDPVRRATLPGEIEQEIAVFDVRMREMQALVKGRDDANLATVQADMSAYEAALKKSAAFALANDKKAAEEMIQGVAGPLYDRVDTALDGLTATKRKALDAGTLDAASISSTAFWSMTMIAVIGLISIGGLAIAVVRRQIVRPLGTITGMMGILASGDNDIDVPGTDRQDEIGGIARAVLVFRDAAIAKREGEAAKQRADAEQKLVVDRLAGGLAQLSNGDLTTQMAGFPSSYAGLEVDFNNAVEGLRLTMTAIAATSGSIRTGASEVDQASGDLSRRTEQQAASLEETAAAMDQINSNVRQTAENSAKANVAVGQAKIDAEKSGEIVRETVMAMNGIEHASQEISEIISVIDGIAFQTNLLALNAGVEAARAGDAGRGFAVVASEVRALAQRAADAAKDVKTRILASSAQVENGVKLVGETGKSLGRICQRVDEVSSLVHDIAAAAQEQSSSLQQVNTAVGDMDNVTQRNAAMVEECAAAARSLATEAEDLVARVDRFSLGDSKAAPAWAPLSAVPRKAPSRAAASRPAAIGNLALAPQPEEDWTEF
jgi:methyl-accepting chemotaxis protein